MHRNQSERGPDRRNSAERDASQAIDGQPRADEDENELEKPDEVPSFLTARELEAREPGKPSQVDDAAEEDEPDEPVESKPKARKR